MQHHVARQCEHVKAFLLSKHPEGALVRDHAGHLPFERRGVKKKSRSHLSRAPSVIGDAELEQRVASLPSLAPQRRQGSRATDPRVQPHPAARGEEWDRGTSSYRPLSSRRGRSMCDPHPHPHPNPTLTLTLTLILTLTLMQRGERRCRRPRS